MQRILHTTRIGEDIALGRRLVNRICRICVFPILRSICVLNGRFWPEAALNKVEFCVIWMAAFGERADPHSD